MLRRIRNARFYFTQTALTVLTICACASQSQAQTAQQQLQNWDTNQANRIQQNANSGYLTQGQANQLENRDAQIRNQEQQYLNQNGGYLTQGEKQQIAGELRHTQRAAVHDENRNGFAPNGYQPYQGYTGQGWSGAPAYYNPNFAGNPNVNPASIQPTTQQQNPYHHHHHRQGFGQFLQGGNGQGLGQIFSGNNGQGLQQQSFGQWMH